MELFAFLASIGKGHLRQLPVMAFHPLDLEQLYLEVSSYGGYQGVMAKLGTWSCIWKSLDHDKRPAKQQMTDASFRLRRIYERYLLEYELDQHPDRRHVADSSNKNTKATAKTKDAEDSLITLQCRKRRRGGCREVNVEAELSLCNIVDSTSKRRCVGKPRVTYADDFYEPPKPRAAANRDSFSLFPPSSCPPPEPAEPEKILTLEAAAADALLLLQGENWAKNREALHRYQQRCCV
jgi:hypothetical protein